MEQIAGVAAAYGIRYRKRPVDSAAGYVVDHTASILLLDRGGRLSLIRRSDTKPDEMASDLRRLIKL